jgi:hypothetical protein
VRCTCFRSDFRPGLVALTLRSRREKCWVLMLLVREDLRLDHTEGADVDRVGADIELSRRRKFRTKIADVTKNIDSRARISKTKLDRRSDDWNGHRDFDVEICGCDGEPHRHAPNLLTGWVVRVFDDRIPPRLLYECGVRGRLAQADQIRDLVEYPLPTSSINVETGVRPVKIAGGDAWPSGFRFGGRASC